MARETGSGRTASKVDEKPHVIALVATADRPELLSSRSIPSILRQVELPLAIIIVDDSIRIENRNKNSQYVNSIRAEGIHVELIENTRTKGASGAWNTGIEWMLGKVESPDLVYAAILDDDDEWHEEYLSKSLDLIIKGRYDMIASDMLRIEQRGVLEYQNAAPHRLDAEECLVRNPGIQASNLVIRLTTMLCCGSYDEALLSCTDRDLCIRLADLEHVHYARLPETLVTHYAEQHRERLTTRGSNAKNSGLDMFWAKYGGRMDQDQREIYRKRSAHLFDWEPRDPVLPSVPHEAEISRKRDIQLSPPQLPHACGLLPPPNTVPFQLLVGVISSEPNTLIPLFESFQMHGIVAQFTVLINGMGSEDVEYLREKCNEMMLNYTLIEEAQQTLDAKVGIFGTVYSHRQEGKVGIAQARTMIQRYLGREMNNNPGSIGWLLDDDMRVDERACVYLQWLPHFRKDGVDVLLGAYEGSSPNPPLNGLRVQLVDLLHNLIWLEKLPLHIKMPNRYQENLTSQRLHPDYYYDLSRKHTSHLERVHWLTPKFENETVLEAKSMLIEESIRLVEGVPTTRPLVARLPLNPVLEAKSSVNRGGTTFILNSRTITQTPNINIRVNNREARRSDMMWAIINKHYRGFNIKSTGFPIVHEARKQENQRLDFEKVQSEFIGSAMYAALTTFLEIHPHHQLKFSPRDIEEVECLCNQHLKARTVALQSSIYRIRGLIGSLNKLQVSIRPSKLIHVLQEWFDDPRWNKFHKETKSLTHSEIYNFLNTIVEVAEDFDCQMMVKDSKPVDF